MPEPDNASAYAVQFDALRDRFLAGLPARIKEMECAKDSAALESVLHRLAGAAGAFGFEEVSDLARAAMQACKARPENVAASEALLHLKAALQALRISE